MTQAYGLVRPQFETSHNRPYMDFPPCTAHHFVCAHPADQVAHPPHHRHDSGRTGHRRARVQHPGARQQFRAFRQGRCLLHHVPGGAGDEYGRLQEEPRQGGGAGPAGFHHPHQHRYGDQRAPAQVQPHHFHPAGQYVCLAYAGGLSHCHPLRHLAPAQCEHRRGRYGRHRYASPWAVRPSPIR